MGSGLMRPRYALIALVLFGIASWLVVAWLFGVWP